MKPQIENLGKVSITVESEYWSKDRQYDRLVIVEDTNTIASYISRQEVPAGINITDREYWIPIGRVSDYLENFAEETLGALIYRKQEIDTALTNVQKFHDTAYRNIQQLTDETIEELKERLKEVDNANETYQNNENSRVNAESIRVTKENARISKENERIANEALRQSAEHNRELAEEERQRKYTNEYDAYENNRRNAETLRNAAESARQEQEVYRRSNEETRQSNDSIRTGNETVRQSAETSRQQAEQARVIAENARVTAENNRELQEGNPEDKPDANGSRWARYNKAEADRTAIAQQEENTRQSNFTTAETTRQNTFTTNEGKSSDSANASGSRWARFNKALNDATTALNNKITEIQNKANTDLGDISNFAETAVNIEKALENKANIDGSYESMTVGSAKYLAASSNIIVSEMPSTLNNRPRRLNDTDIYVTAKQLKFPSTNINIASISPISGFYHQLINTEYEYVENDITVKCVGNVVHVSGISKGENITILPDTVTLDPLIDIICVIGGKGSLKTYKGSTEYGSSYQYTFPYKGKSIRYMGTPTQISSLKIYGISSGTELNETYILVGLNSTLFGNNEVSTTNTNKQDIPTILRYIDEEKLCQYCPGELFNPITTITCPTYNNICAFFESKKGYIDDNNKIVYDNTSNTYVIGYVPVDPYTTYLTTARTSSVYFYNEHKQFNRVETLSISQFSTAYSDCYIAMVVSGGAGIGLSLSVGPSSYTSIFQSKIDYSKIKILNYKNEEVYLECNPKEINFKNNTITLGRIIYELNTPELYTYKDNKFLIYKAKPYINKSCYKYMHCIDNNIIKKSINVSNKITNVTNDIIINQYITNKYNQYEGELYVYVDNETNVDEYISNLKVYFVETPLSNNTIPMVSNANGNVIKSSNAANKTIIAFTVNAVSITFSQQTDAITILDNLPQNYLTIDSLNELLEAIKQITNKTITPKYNNNTKTYTFTVK